MIRIESDAEKFAASGVEVLSGWSIRKWRSPERWLPASSRLAFTFVPEERRLRNVDVGGEHPEMCLTPRTERCRQCRRGSGISPGATRPDWRLLPADANR